MTVTRAGPQKAVTSVQNDYPITAYRCNDDNTASSSELLSQGSFLRICIMVDSLVIDDVHIKEIRSLVISQPGGLASDSHPIVSGTSNSLTAVDCNSQLDGRCNIMMQLPSKFFTQDSNTPFLRLDGVAILTFDLNRQLINVPCELNSCRHRQILRQVDIGNPSTFSIQVEVERQRDVMDTQKKKKTGTSEPTSIAITAVVGILAIAAVGVVCYCLWCYIALIQLQSKQLDQTVKSEHKDTPSSYTCRKNRSNTIDSDESAYHTAASDLSRDIVIDLEDMANKTVSNSEEDDFVSVLYIRAMQNFQWS